MILAAITANAATHLATANRIPDGDAQGYGKEFTLAITGHKGAVMTGIYLDVRGEACAQAKASYLITVLAIIQGNIFKLAKTSCVIPGLNAS